MLLDAVYHLKDGAGVAITAKSGTTRAPCRLLMQLVLRPENAGHNLARCTYGLVLKLCIKEHHPLIQSAVPLKLHVPTDMLT
jgi:hypothetical protein